MVIAFILLLLVLIWAAVRLGGVRSADPAARTTGRRRSRRSRDDGLADIPSTGAGLGGGSADGRMAAPDEGDGGFRGGGGDFGGGGASGSWGDGGSDGGGD
jgi:uncharacterized protein